MPRYLHLLSLSLVSAELNSISNSLFSSAQQLPYAFFVPEAQIQDPIKHAHLFRRDACAASYTSCSSNVCCQPDTRCTTDFAGRPACCPNGAVCTGTIGGGVAAASTTSSAGQATQTVTNTAVAGGGAIASGSTATVTVTVGYAAPSTVLGVATTIAVGAGSAATITPLPGTTATGTVPNAPFAWAYIPHSFANAAQCSSYATSCADTFNTCTSQLAVGGGGGVTVVGAGITTANGAGIAGVASAASVCSSLSTAACYGLQTGLCAQYGGSTNGAYGSQRGFGAGAGLLAGVLGAVFI